MTTYCLQFALNAWMDNDDGVYRINKPFFFVAVSVAMIAFIYGSLKIAQQPALRELRAMAKDLEEPAEIQQPPKREGRNMIMFLTPRKTPLVKKDDKEEPATRAVRAITAPPRPTAARLASKPGGNG